MRARNLLSLGLVTVTVVACSKPPAEVALEVEIDPSLELELALFGSSAESSDAAVISEIELIRRQAPVAPARPAQVRPEPSEDAAISAPPIAPAEVEPAVVEAPAAPAAATLEPVSAGEVTAAAGDGEEHGDHAGPDVGSGRGRGPILVRGGGSGRDPCVIHRPGSGGVALGPVGVLINDRTPAGVRLGGGSHYPSSGRIPSGRGGVMFPGGIR